MYESIDDGLVCGVCFLDIEKCFDTISHDILLQKLKHYGIGGNAFDWFRDYLCGRRQCVRVDNITSELRPCPIGVPQGSILGPILFLLYVNEFPQYIGNQNCNIFADGAMIYSFGNDITETEANLQNALDSLSPSNHTLRMWFLNSLQASMKYIFYKARTTTCSREYNTIYKQGFSRFGISPS